MHNVAVIWSADDGQLQSRKHRRQAAPSSVLRYAQVSQTLMVRPDACDGLEHAGIPRKEGR